MEIAKEESEAYLWAVQCGGTWDFPSVLRDALRRHVAAAMRLEFEREHKLSSTRGRVGTVSCTVCIRSDPRHMFKAADWERAAHEALMGD